MRFETEAPVDDILVATSAGGFVAIQAKTSVSLSRDLASPFGKTITQFVRHWLACRDGDGALRWNRPLDLEIDRLILAVGRDTPASVQAALADALRLKAQPGGGELNGAQARAFEDFESCVEQAWGKSTAAPYDPALVTKLAGLIRVLPFDPTGLEREAVVATMAAAFVRPNEAAAALAILETLCGELMAKRGGFDLATVRQELLARELALLPPPDFRQDIARLQAHSRAVADSLARYEVIEAASGDQMTVARECQASIREAATSGSLLIVGEPGAGKSGVLNALARDLHELGNDVVELAVDRYSVESLEGLAQELGLRHGLVETLDAWDGPDPGWLIVDALDATRGGKGEGVFRTLIERVLESGGRWRVIASIRTFDLRMGQQFRALFKGTPPIAALQESGFPKVRHVRVPTWSEAEFAHLLTRAPALAAALENAPPALRDLAVVPFNTRLLCELIKDGLVTADFSHVASQVELLQLYWEHRVEAQGAPAQACILRIVEAMVAARALRAPFALAAGSNPATLDGLEREGVLISVDQRRWVQFRHHLLFDFAAARTLLDPDGLIAGTRQFPKKNARGLMLAPALTFLLREIWDRNQSRSDFWSAAANLLADDHGDPVIRSAAGRICAEYPREPQDLILLGRRIVGGDSQAAQAFIHISGALAIRLEDHPETPLVPWVRLLGSLASNVAPVAGTVRFLLFRLIGSVTDEVGRSCLGTAARALLSYGLTLEHPGNMVASAIDLVGDTYATDAAGSRALLERVFDPVRLEAYAPEEVPALCRKIEAIAAADPAFAERIYRATYAFSVTEKRETTMGASQIMPLRSNARQDYEMARYALGEYITAFLAQHPEHAVAAIVEAVEVYVAREHPRSSDMLDVEVASGERRVRLREDWSHLWGYDPDDSYPDDAEVLVNKLLDFLRTAEPAPVLLVAERLVAIASLAIFWSRLFLAAVARDDALLDLMLPIAMQEAFLTLPDTRKDAVDVVAKGYDRLGQAARTTFEAEVAAFDFSQFQRPEDARTSFERRLFGAVGQAKLVSEHARTVAAERGRSYEVQNDRPFVISTIHDAADSYHWIEKLDRESPANQRLMAAIETIKQTLKLEAARKDIIPAPLVTSLGAMEALAAEIDRSAQDPQLIVYAEGQIALGLSRIVEAELVPAADETEATDRFLTLLDLVAVSQGPELRDDTEADFERGASWGSPAPRVNAAEIALDLMLLRSDLYVTFAPIITTLLDDAHPAVRLQAALRLVRIWDVDREGFWQRLTDRLETELNQSVIDHVAASVLGRVLHADRPRTEPLVLALLERFADEPERQERMRKTLADLLAILWVTYESAPAFTVLDSWIGTAAAHVPELSKITSTLRGAFVAGLSGEAGADDGGLRHRSQALAHAIVLAANEGLAAHFALDDHSEAQMDVARAHAKLLDAVCRELFFGSGARRDRSDAEPAVVDQELAQFFAEVAPTLKGIGDYATPHTVYYLLQLLEYLLPLHPACAFDLTAHALRRGGQRTGYQFESLGADLVVRLVGVFLADHKQLFDDPARRDALIDCLEIFMDAGWPAARRLLYRLPELLQ
ncbi:MULTISPECIES: ATP-binding protein [Mesorhizobium]|nr:MULTISPECIES: ATP-binding protein [Mesorhizobium]